MRQIRQISRNKRIADILAIIFVGLASGFVFKYFDDTMTYPNMERLSDFVIYTFALDRVFSEMAVFLVIGVMLAIYASTPIRAGVNNLLYFICLNIGYYGYMYHYWGFVAMGYIRFWVVFAMITPLLGYVVWFVQDTTTFARIMKIILVAVMMVFCFSSLSFEWTYKGLVYVSLFVLFLAVVKPTIRQTIIGIIIAVCTIVIF